MVGGDYDGGLVGVDGIVVDEIEKCDDAVVGPVDGVIPDIRAPVVIVSLGIGVDEVDEGVVEGGGLDIGKKCVHECRRAVVKIQESVDFVCAVVFADGIRGAVCGVP